MTGAGLQPGDFTPTRAAPRARVGKFYYKPPSGGRAGPTSSSGSGQAARRPAAPASKDQRVWMFTHQAVIMSFRYVLEGLTEQELLEIDRTSTIPNASMTTYRREDDGLTLAAFADTVRGQRRRGRGDPRALAGRPRRWAGLTRSSSPRRCCGSGRCPRPGRASWCWPRSGTGRGSGRLLVGSGCGRSRTRRPSWSRDQWGGLEERRSVVDALGSAYLAPATPRGCATSRVAPSRR